MRSIVSAMLGCAAAAAPGGLAQPTAQVAAPASPRIEAQVDRRVELFTLLARLAGFEEFNMPASTSPYARAAEAWIGAQRDHPAVQRMRELRRSRGVSFDAIASLAVHVEDSVTLEERLPFETPPERLDARFGLEGARALLAEARDFVQAADTEGFFDSQEERFTAAATRLRAVIERSQALPWFDRTFGARGGARYCAIPGFLCGGGNYGVGIRFPDGRDEEILPVFGCSSFDVAGIPLFGREMDGLVIHELCHSYTNAHVDRVAARLRPPAERLFARAADAMRAQAYGNWQALSYETLVRATVVACRRTTEGEAAGAAQAREESQRGFTWVPAIAADLARFEGDRAKWPTFVDFLPEIVAAFAREADRIDPRAAPPPPTATLPPSSDLRPWLVAEGIGPRAQGGRPTCSVFTVASALEAAVAQVEGRGRRLSVEYFNWAANAATGRRDDGDFFHCILAGWDAFGAIDEAGWPYATAFERNAAPAERVVATGKANLDRWRSDLSVHWIKPLGPPGLDEPQFLEFRRRLAAGDAVAIGSGHSRLAVGFVEDPAAPGGGRVLTIDSGSESFGEVGADFVREQVNDAFWVEAVRGGDPAASIDLRPLLLGQGILPDAEPDASLVAARAIVTLLEFELAVAGTRPARATLAAFLATVASDAESGGPLGSGRLAALDLVVAGDPAAAGSRRLAPISRSLAARHPVVARLESGEVRLIVGQTIDPSGDGAGEWILVDPRAGGYARLPFSIAARAIVEAAVCHDPASAVPADAVDH